MNDRELEELQRRADAAWLPASAVGASAAQQRVDTIETRGDASCPADVRAQCPAGRHPVSDGRGGWMFVRNDGQADRVDADREARRDY